MTTTEGIGRESLEDPRKRGEVAERSVRVPKLNDAEKRVLVFLADRWNDYDGGGFYSFEPIAKDTKLYRATVRRACRSLTRRGLAEFSAGLVNSDGDFAGAGYSATKQGASLVSSIREALSDRSSDVGTKNV